MPFTTQFQLGVELTKFLPVRSLVETGFTSVINMARELRKSGSDLLVEEDLATLFGRAKIDPVVEVQFKQSVMKDSNSTFINLSSGSEIGFDREPGPTVKRALSSKDPFYLSTVIQLSMLVWFLDTSMLASAISECMSRRHQLGLPNAAPEPGFGSILGTLEACSAQTSAFPWNYYAQTVEQRLRESYPLYGRRLIGQKSLISLSPTTMAAAVDFFFLIQSLPEDRRISLSNQKGMITIIIWAHYILGLSVNVQGMPNGKVVFGQQGPAQVLISWRPNFDSSQDQEICLLDKDSKIIFKSLPTDLGLDEVFAEERHPLLNYGTLWFRRACNTYVSIPDDDPLYLTLVHYVVALAIAAEKRLVRGKFTSAKEIVKDSILCDRLRIERWRILQSAKLLFEEFDIDMKAVDQIADKIPLESSLEEVKNPRILDLYLERVEEDARKLALKQLWLPCMIAMTLVVANIEALSECQCLPLITDVSYTENIHVTKRIWRSHGPLLIEEFDLPGLMATLLIGRRFIRDQTLDVDAFVLSDVGWSLVLSAVSDGDPVDIQPERLRLCKGTPTNIRTGASKRLVKDFEQDVDFRPMRKILDRGNSYVPRCVTSIARRFEYLTEDKEAFRISLRYNALLSATAVGASENFPKVELMDGYRNQHIALWMTSKVPPCDHSHIHLESARLGIDMAAGTSLDWRNEAEVPLNDGNLAEQLADFTEVPERVCICLVKGDARSRWLAVSEGSKSSHRRNILRGERTCEDCAADTALARPGKWLLII